MTEITTQLSTIPADRDKLERQQGTTTVYLA